MMQFPPSEYAVAGAAAPANIGYVAAEDGPTLLGSSFGPPRPALFELLRPNGAMVPPGSRSSLSTAISERMSASQWHVRVLADGSRCIVMTDPLSASCGLVVDSRGRPAEVEVTVKYPLGVFFRPRWIKGAPPADGTIVAIEAASNERRIVRFSETGELEYDEFDVIHAPATVRVESAELVAVGSGTVLLYKGVRAELVAGGPTHRTDGAHFTWWPGHIFAVELDAGFGAVSGPHQPFGDRLVFDLDVDVTGDRLVVLATTAEGLILWQWRASEQSAEPTLIGQLDATAPLTQPRVAVDGEVIHYAAVAGARTGAMRILAGRAAMP